MNSNHYMAPRFLKDNNMNNAKITLIALLAVTFVITTGIPKADAHPTPSIMTLFPFDTDDGAQRIWYDMDSLELVTLDGQSNAVGLRLIGEVSRAAIDSTDMNVTEAPTYRTGDSKFDAKRLGGTNVFGYTPHVGTGSNMYKIIYLNTNDDLDYNTSAGCRHPWDFVNPQYIANHEFGHFAGLSHHSFWPLDDTHTAMKGSCNPGQASLRAPDISDINAWYD